MSAVDLLALALERAYDNVVGYRTGTIVVGADGGWVHIPAGTGLVASIDWAVEAGVISADERDVLRPAIRAYFELLCGQHDRPLEHLRDQTRAVTGIYHRFHS